MIPLLHVVVGALVAAAMPSASRGRWATPPVVVASLSAHGHAAAVFGVRPRGEWRELELYLCTTEGDCRRLALGGRQGYPMGVSLSPDGSQLLLFWSDTEREGKPFENRSITWIEIDGDRPRVIGEIHGAMTAYVTKCARLLQYPWDLGGQRWFGLDLSYAVRRFVIYQRNRETVLHEHPPGVEAVWFAATGDALNAYKPDDYGYYARGHRRPGAILRITPDSVSQVHRLEATAVGGVGDHLYATSYDGGLLITETDLGTGRTRTYRVPSNDMPPGSVVVALHVLGDGALLLETEDGLYVARRPYADVTTVQQFPPESYLETEIAVDDGWAWSARRGMSRDHTVLIARPIP